MNTTSFTHTIRSCCLEIARCLRRTISRVPSMLTGFFTLVGLLRKIA